LAGFFLYFQDSSFGEMICQVADHLCVLFSVVCGLFSILGLDMIASSFGLRSSLRQQRCGSSSRILIPPAEARDFYLQTLNHRLSATRDSRQIN
jgi:hypothetical protein